MAAVGATVSLELATVTVTGADKAVLPLTSRARATSVCVPFAAVVVFQEML